MATEIITYKNNDLDIRLTVSSATVLAGMKRTRLRMTGDKLEKERVERGEEHDLDRLILRVSIYPDLIAATTEAEGLPWPLDFETFLTLPEPFWAMWEEVVYRLNPHWLPTEEKKI
ncbi:MAG: hypothetical protein KDJ52_00170 [Anaerolineae bacterium]|nr:hypothetical protein [Anaerolineae bacterium]